MRSVIRCTEMLTWEQDRTGWVSNGYRIELVEPYRWVLLRNEPATTAVRAALAQLAETRTLTQCKREAEKLDAAGRLAQLRRRLWGQLILALVAFATVPTLAPPWDLAMVLILLAVAARAVGFLAGIYLARSHVTGHDLFYQ